MICFSLILRFIYSILSPREGLCIFHCSSLALFQYSSLDTRIWSQPLCRRNVAVILLSSCQILISGHKLAMCIRPEHQEWAEWAIWGVCPFSAEWAPVSDELIIASTVSNKAAVTTVAHVMMSWTPGGGCLWRWSSSDQSWEHETTTCHYNTLYKCPGSALSVARCYLYIFLSLI